jgi:hypothetical protein
MGVSGKKRVKTKEKIFHLLFVYDQIDKQQSLG